MLNQETKRKIDSARDILVGKVPDPKAQIDQITTALIYKFMDDMDREAEEFGGKARFFSNGFEKYAWSKLLGAKLGGHERLELYAEAITKMAQNPHIPQLFRSIFKDAFLPYRSPETLSLFLKEINGFSYDHSEDLGDAFEYLLSIMASQGDAGQFRTPRHIIDFIVEVVAPKKNETILDPACGTAGFLISAYKHILNKNKNKQLTPDEKKKLMNNLVGYDISPDMVKLSLVNMYLHSFSEPKIFEYDTLSSEDKWDESFDVILANPPFMSPKGGIRPHKRFSVQANRSEVLFVDYILEHLNQKGRAGIIVPEGIVFKNDSAYKELRKLLIEDGLFAVVSLPAGIFNPYSGVKTSILFFNNKIAKRTEEILFINIANDGHSLGAQRLPIDKNDLPRALDIIKRHEQSFDDEKIYLKGKDVSDGFAHLVSKQEIVKNGDYNLSGERYKKDPFLFLQQVMDETQEKIEMYSKALEPMRKMTEEYNKAIKALSGPADEIKRIINSPAFSSFSKDIQHATESMQKAFQANNIKRIIKSAQYISSQKKQKWPMVELDEIINLDFGKRITKNKNSGTKFPVYGGGGESFRTDEFNRENEYVISRFAMSENCVRFVSGKFFLLDSGFSFSIKNNYKDKINKNFLSCLFLGLQDKIYALARGHAQKNLDVKRFRTFKIPIPPLDVQNKIMGRIENKQNIIDDAQKLITKTERERANSGQVFERIDCEKVELGEILKYEQPTKYIVKSTNYNDKYKTPVLTAGKTFILGYTDETSGIFKENLPVIIFDDFTTATKLVDFPFKVKSSAMKILHNDSKKADIKYLYHLMQNIIFPKNEHKRYWISEYSKIKIPLPSLEIQKNIAKQFNQQSQAVNANKQLINVFEDQIRDEVNEVLGE